MAWRTRPASQQVCVQGAQPVMPEYRPEDMVFEMEEEKIPAYNPPKAADEDDEDATAEMEKGENGAQAFMVCRCSLSTVEVQ